MNSFPLVLNPENKENFKNLWIENISNLIRQDIYLFITGRKDENDYVDLDKYFNLYNSYGKVTVSNIIYNIIQELNNLNWKTKLSFGDTGLFIYSTEELPKSCW
jgi:hypothetical protein